MRKEYVRILVIMVINLVCAGAFFTALESLGLREQVYRNPILSVLVGGGFSVLMIGVALFLYKFWDKKPLHTLGFSLGKMDGLFSGLVSLSILLCYWLLITGLEKAGLVTIIHANDYFSSNRYLLILPFFFSWVVAALHEEISNRAYIYANMRHLRTGKMMFISSLLFAILHVFQGLNLFYFISLFTGGILFMYIYVKTGNVWAGAIIHATINFSNSFFLNDDPNANFSLFLLQDIQETKALPILFGFQLGIFILILFAAQIAYKKREKINPFLKKQESV